MTKQELKRIEVNMFRLAEGVERLRYYLAMAREGRTNMDNMLWTEFNSLALLAEGGRAVVEMAEPSSAE